MRAATRAEPPPNMKRRPCGGGASYFDPASIEMVNMNSRIIRRRRRPFKAAEGPFRARPVHHVISMAMAGIAPGRALVQQAAGPDDRGLVVPHVRRPVGAEGV